MTLPPSPARPSHPMLFGVLVLPFAAAVGLLQVAVPYWLREGGVGLAAIGVVSGTAFYPMALKILWVPLIDVAARRKRWYLAASLATAVLVAGSCALAEPARHLVLFTALMTAAQATAATASAALNALMATTTRAEDKGRAGGYYMAGNVGGTGVLGALPIWLAGHLGRLPAGLVLGTLCVLACVPVLRVAEVGSPPAATERPLSAARTKLGLIARDAWVLISSREGITGLVLCAAPVGCGALTNLFSGMARDYAASEHTVELVTGLLGGGVGALGSVLGGHLADRFNRRLMYVLAGGLTALCAIAMASAPMNPATFTWGVLAYSFANGIAFAAFAGMVLEMVSKGVAVTTKYALFVAVSNQAISYTTILDGRAAGFRGIGTLATVIFDAAITFVGIAVVGGAAWISRKVPARDAVAV